MGWVGELSERGGVRRGRKGCITKFPHCMMALPDMVVVCILIIPLRCYCC